MFGGKKSEKKKRFILFVKKKKKKYRKNTNFVLLNSSEIDFYNLLTEKIKRLFLFP